jgi:hypothetical protein
LRLLGLSCEKRYADNAGSDQNQRSDHLEPARTQIGKNQPENAREHSRQALFVRLTLTLLFT